MIYEVQPPSAALRPFVACFWRLTGEVADAAAGGEPVLPDGCRELVVHRGAPFAEQRRGEWHRQPRALFVEQQLSPVVLRPTGGVDAFGVRFTPAGVGGLFGKTREGEIGAIVELERALPALGADAVDAVAAPGDFAADCRRMGRRLERQLAAAAPDAAVVAALERIAARGGELRIADLAADVGLSRRQLERRFLAAVGLPPKRYARLARVRRFLALLQAAERGGGARAAVELGYADQAHAIRETRELAGDSPARLLADPPRLTALFAGWLDAA